MAWWNEAAGDQTPPVTLDRVAAWFDDNRFAYERRLDNSAIVAGFDGYSCVVAVVDDNLLAIYARSWLNLPDEVEVTAPLRELLNTLNQSQSIPTLSTFVDDDGRQVAAEVAAVVAEGLNDDQLANILDTSLQAIVSNFEGLEEVGKSLRATGERRGAASAISDDVAPTMRPPSAAHSEGTAQ